MSANDFDIMVTGGSANSEASFQDLEWVASRAQQLADDIQSFALDLLDIEFDDTFRASAEYARDSYAAVQAAFDYARLEAGGLFAASDTMQGRHDDLITAIRNYQDADSVMASVMDDVGNWFYDTTGMARAKLAWIATMTSTYGEEWLVAHPGELQDVLHDLPDSFLVSLSFSNAVGVLAAAWGDGDGHARVIGDNVPGTTEYATQPPNGLGNIFQSLADRDDDAVDGYDEVDVRRVEQPDSTVAYIVDIPGTQDWNLPDGGLGLNDNTNDLTTNLHAMAEQATAREEAIARALEEADSAGAFLSSDPDTQVDVTRFELTRD